MLTIIPTDRLSQWGLRDPAQAARHLQAVADSGIPPEFLQKLSEQLTECLPTANEPDRVVADLATFVSCVAADQTSQPLLVSSADILIHIVSVLLISPHLSSQLLQDPELFCILARDANVAHPHVQRVEAITASLWPLRKDSKKVATLLARWKNRELFQIAYRAVVSQSRLEVVADQITNLCAVMLDAAVNHLRAKHEERYGVPRGPNGETAQFAIIGLGKLGGSEMSYSNDLEIMCIYDVEGKTDGLRSQANQLFFNAVAKDLEKLLGTAVCEDAIYQIDYRLKSADDSLVMTLKEACRHYDLAGRTWERQAFVKARPVAGDLELGEQFLARMASWVYHRYLSLAEITEIKALKRRIEQLTRTAGEETLDLEKGRGGIRDIEFVIQFLQLLNGGELPSVRVTNTLQAIEQLAAEGCLSDQEQSLLGKNYRFLCGLEHHLQLIFGMQSYRLPREGKERNSLAKHMGYLPETESSGARNFKETYTKITEENRRVLNHLLHDAFADENPSSPEIDLILDPDPTPEKIDQVLKQYDFRDTARAYRHLMELTRESVPFLSARRCRYFLATIARDLLKELSQFPDPDSTLVQLCRTSDSLGGKGVLWELFSFNRPSLTLYVHLCATSPYLSNILIRNPGMIDELMDGLMLKKLPDFQQQETALSELCSGAEDIDPVIQSFNNSQILRVGVRDIVGKERVEETGGALADIADTCLRQWARVEYAELVRRLGEPVISLGPRAGHIAEFVVLALGRLGGRELGYGGVLEVAFLFESDGGTQHRRSERKKQQVTSNQHFFGELSQRIIKRASQCGLYGRLYEIDLPLRFAGAPLAISLQGLQAYFQSENVSLRERMALCRARVVLGNEVIHNQAMEVIHQTAFREKSQSINIEEVFCLREQSEAAVPVEDFHFGWGGIADIEFIAQTLQLCHAYSHPSLRQSNTMATLMVLREKGLLEGRDHELLKHNYRLFRALEMRLQWMESASSTLLPTGQHLAKSALMLKFQNAGQLQESVEQARQQNRAILEKLLGVTVAGA